MCSFATLTGMVSVREGTLGARLLRARLEYGSRANPPRVVTQLEIARELGVSGVAVGGWEADRNEPGLDKIRALAKLYGVRVGWLVDGELPMRAEGGEDTQPARHEPSNPVSPTNGTPRLTPDQIRVVDVQGVPTKQQPRSGKPGKKRRRDDRSAVA